MIFTRRFGTLAARPDFNLVNETVQEHTPSVPLTDAEPRQATEAAAA